MADGRHLGDGAERGGVEAGQIDHHDVVRATGQVRHRRDRGGDRHAGIVGRQLLQPGTGNGLIGDDGDSEHGLLLACPRTRESPALRRTPGGRGSQGGR
ncbi:hypothetical protein DMB66_22725 [Actinoplanes sp. ATCC 53533]|nr:hypothetical protein DMB66_22725 [Actinoplanes sp. ATCC 53533]